MTIYSLNVKKKKKQPKSGEALKHTKKVSIAANLKKKKKNSRPFPQKRRHLKINHPININHKCFFAC